MTPKFWMIWREGSNSPVKGHTGKESAINEAERLTKGMPGYKFYVLEAVTCVEGIVQINRETL